MDIGHHPGALTPLPEDEPARRERHAFLLRRLAEIAMGMAERAGERAAQEVSRSAHVAPSEEGAARLAEAERSFHRAAGMVRQTIALEVRVMAGTVFPERGWRAPGRTRLREVVRAAADAGFDAETATEVRREIEARLDEALGGGPDDTMDATLLKSVDEDLAIVARLRSLADSRVRGLPDMLPERLPEVAAARLGEDAPDVDPPPW